jgi:thioredoxin reductase (NADPH)
MAAQYDLVIIGSGTAGLTAGLFGARYGLRTLVLENLLPGGQIINAERIENFPGFPKSVPGGEFAPMLMEQTMASGVNFQMDGATALSREDPYWMVSTDGGDYSAKTVILAMGSSLKKLGVPGEEELRGRGVSTCATCDGPFFRDQVVCVIGAGDSAVDEAEVLSGFASQVILFQRRDKMRAQKVLQERILGLGKVNVVSNIEVQEIIGGEEVTGVKTKDMVTGETSQVDLQGVFIYVGLEPNTHFLEGTISMDNAGHIPTDVCMGTSAAGVFAAGDVRQYSSRQLVSSAGDGATAAISAFQYIQRQEWPTDN